MGLTVFVVNPDVAALARQLVDLRAAGFSVIGVATFAEARALLRTSRPDALVTTLRVGAFNGLHLAMLARMIHGSVPTIVTGEADVVLQSEADRLDATYLVAPVRNVDLLTALWGASQRDGRSLVRAAMARSVTAGGARSWPGSIDTMRATPN